MNELPDSAKKLLVLERGAPGPSLETRARVRSGVALALAAGLGAAVSGAQPATAAGSAAGAAKLGFLAGATGKLWLAAGAIAVLGGVGVALRHGTPESRLSPLAANAHARVTLQAPVPAPATAAPSERARAADDVASDAKARSEPAQRDAKKPRSSARVVESSDLRAETLLLAAASSALERGELPAARAQLAQYRSEFAHGQLRREERGLELLANCMTNESGAMVHARRYLSEDPSSMLAERIQTTCKVKPQP